MWVHSEFCDNSDYLLDPVNKQQRKTLLQNLELDLVDDLEDSEIV